MGDRTGSEQFRLRVTRVSAVESDDEEAESE